jgi:hypothetical protein
MFTSLSKKPSQISLSAWNCPGFDGLTDKEQAKKNRTQLLGPGD